MDAQSSEVEIRPILDDNYVFFFRDGPDVCLVDPGDAGPCLQYLSKNKLNLSSILITHHHADHIDGIAELKRNFPSVKVFAPLKNKSQIPLVDFGVSDQQILKLNTTEFRVIELPGHTMGICGYHNQQNSWLFSGDVLFGLGCGRLFEGSPEVAFSSLSKIAKLSSDTLVFCTHEYTMQNLQFVEELIRQKKMPRSFDAAFFETYKGRLLQLRAQNKPSVPLKLADELKVNPFLLSVAEQRLEVFTELRNARNHFRPK